MSEFQNQTVIITDSGCDLPRQFVEKENIVPMGFMCNFKNEDIEDDFGQTIKPKAFYDALREGEMPTTSQINVYRFMETFNKYIKEGKSIIYIAMSSALTGSINSANIAIQSVKEEFPQADITVVDTKCASLGQGLLVYYAYEMLEKGYSKDEIVTWLEENKLKMNHWVVVNDLHHLKRGGRVSASAAAIGSLLNINPVIIMDNEGRLIPHSKIRGRKKAIKGLVDKFEEKANTTIEQVVAINHGDCLEEAEYLASMIKQHKNVKDVIINYAGTAIGAHTGPGLISLFFIGHERY